jgi:hypothetical protein
MTAREQALPRDDPESTAASQQFDCALIVKLLRNAPTGHQPGWEQEDTLWVRKAF